MLFRESPPLGLRGVGEGEGEAELPQEAQAEILGQQGEGLLGGREGLLQAEGVVDREAEEGDEVGLAADVLAQRDEELKNKGRMTRINDRLKKKKQVDPLLLLAAFNSFFLFENRPKF